MGSFAVCTRQILAGVAANFMQERKRQGLDEAASTVEVQIAHVTCESERCPAQQRCAATYSMQLIIKLHD
jgi:hypothetical protein